MWLQRLTKHLLAHRGQALALTLITAMLSTFLPFIAIVAVSIAILVTLLRGAYEGGLFTLAATLPYAAIFFIKQQMAPPLVVWIGAAAAILTNVLTYVFALLLRRKMSFNQLIQLTALIGILIISVIHLAYPSIAEWWGVTLEASYGQLSKVFNLFNQTDAKDQAQVLQAISVTKYYATGYVIAAILLNAFFQLLMARWWLAVVFSPGSLQKELHGIHLSSLAGTLFVLGLAFSYFGNSVVLDIMPIAYVLFAAAGLSLVHYAFGLAYSSMRWFWLAIFYITLLIALPISLFFMVMLGLFDIWFDLRKRLKKN